MPMNHITGHHAASGYTPSKEALKAYHRLIDGDGQVINGVHEIEDNMPGLPMSPGSYAAHTKDLNTGNIGVSILAMGDATWNNPKPPKYPVRNVQIDAYCKEVARLAMKYGIPVTRSHILTHAEVQTTLHIKQRQKWDFDYDPYYRHTSRDPIRIGDELRQEIARLIRTGPKEQLVQPSKQEIEFLRLPTLHQGATGDDVMKLQSALNVYLIRNTVKSAMRIDGRFGPATRDVVIFFQKKHQLLPDGVVGPLTWETLLTKVADGL